MHKKCIHINMCLNSSYVIKYVYIIKTYIFNLNRKIVVFLLKQDNVVNDLLKRFSPMFFVSKHLQTLLFAA